MYNDKRYWLVHHMHGGETDIITWFDSLYDAHVELKYYSSLPADEWDLGYEVFDSAIDKTLSFVNV